MANNVKELRLSAGMSQAQLAEEVGVSPVEIHRIESNRSPANVNVATAICDALKTPIDDVFPGASGVLAAFGTELQEPELISDLMYAKLREVGLEGDTKQYKLKVVLRGHEDPLFFSFAPSDLDRLFRAIQGEDDDESETSFIVFDSDRLCVAINLHATVFCHFLWDADLGEAIQIADGDSILEDRRYQSVQVFFATSLTPVTIGMEAEDGTGIENDNNCLSSIFYRLDSGGLQAHERVLIVDEDGESAFMRVGDISLLTAPRWMLDVEELDALHSDEEDDQA